MRPSPNHSNRRACAHCRENLELASAKKAELEKEVFDQRYSLAVERTASVQLERAVRDSTQAVCRLLEVRLLLLRLELSGAQPKRLRKQRKSNCCPTD